MFLVIELNCTSKSRGIAKALMDRVLQEVIYFTLSGFNWRRPRQPSGKSQSAGNISGTEIGYVHSCLVRICLIKMFYMKFRLLLLLLIGFCLSAYAQTENPKYDKVLADSLGGDDYGMKSYILVMLKTGPNKIEDKKVLDSLFQGHMENIGRLVADGKLIVAGPLGKNEKTPTYLPNHEKIEKKKM